MHKNPLMRGPGSLKRTRKIKRRESTSGVNGPGCRKHFLLSFPVSGATSCDGGRLKRRLVTVVAVANYVVNFLFAFTVVYAVCGFESAGERERASERERVEMQIMA